MSEINQIAYLGLYEIDDTKDKEDAMIKLVSHIQKCRDIHINFGRTLSPEQSWQLFWRIEDSRNKDFSKLFKDGSPNLKKCPICQKEVTLHGGDIDWKPTCSDHDSGGEPYEITCECGLHFSIGYCDVTDLITKWNSQF